MRGEAIIRPMGTSRRLGMPFAAAGAEAAGSGDLDVVRRWLDRSWLSWRDGSMAGTGGVGNAINPATGAVQSGPMTMDLAVAGLPAIRMGFAWDAITNLLVGGLTSGAALASNTPNAPNLSRVIVEDNTTAAHYSHRAGNALATGTSYRLAFQVRRVVGARHAVCYAVQTAVAGMVVNLTTGAITYMGTAGGSASGGTAVLGADGWWTCSVTISSSASWAGAATIVAGFSSNGTSLDSYAGDNTSALEYRGITVAPLTDYAPLLAEGITRTADSWIWTLPAALPQNAEISHIGVQPYADGDMGVTNQTWTQFSAPSAVSDLVRNAATTLLAQDNAGGGKSASITRSLPNRAISFIQRHYRNASNLYAGYGSTLSVGDPPSGAWAGHTAIHLGHSVTAGRASRAANTLIITPGGCTQAEREAEARLLHLRPVGLAA